MMRPYGSKYYEVILVYANDLPIVSHNPNPIILDQQDSIERPTASLGAQISEFCFPEIDVLSEPNHMPVAGPGIVFGLH